MHLAGVLVTLGLSVIPNWEAVVRQMYDRLQPGGRFVVFDIYTQRKAWPLLEQLGAEVSWRYLPGSPHIRGGTPYVAVARKPNCSGVKVAASKCSSSEAGRARFLFGV
ncbi:MAG: hypothetical protein JRG89_23730 [Deltaproteobacteria bacterium]|nr:hypothetical protein [Deltaproteobacteria bacterium]